MSDMVKGAFCINFSSQGDMIYLTRNIVRIENGAETGAALFQAIDPNSGALSVDWTVAANQPIIKIAVISARSFTVGILAVAWTYDGNALSFDTTADSDGWYADTTKRFACKQDGSTVMLKIIANLASSTVLSNKQITYVIDYQSAGIKESIQQSVDVQIQQAGSDSHAVYIMTTNSELNRNLSSTVLTAQCVYGVKNITIGSSGYTMKWFQDGEEISGATGQSLTVYRNSTDGTPYVDGGSIFVAKLYKNGTLVAQDGQRINDTSDEYQIRATVTPGGSDYVSNSNNASYDLSLLRNGIEQAVNSSIFSWVLYNALGVQTGSGTGSRVTVTKTHAKCTNADGTEYYSDVDCSVTAAL